MRTICILAAVALTISAASAAPLAALNMTLSFTTTGQTEAGAVRQLEAILSEAASSTGWPAVRSEILVSGPVGGPWRADGNLTLAGSAADLLAVEEQYGPLAADIDIRGENFFGVADGSSVHDFGEKASHNLWSAGLVGLSAAGLVVVFRWQAKEVLMLPMIFGGLFGIAGIALFVAYLKYQPYALP